MKSGILYSLVKPHEVRQFPLGIKGAVFGRLRDIDHARLDHVFVVEIGRKIRRDNVSEVWRPRVCVLIRRKGDDFVARFLNRPGFMEPRYARVSQAITPS
jgi:hypothetical protein